MGRIDDIIDACSIQLGGILPTKSDVGHLTGGGNYDSNSDHTDAPYDSSLRQFCEGDWMGYSGCEDDHPLIGDLRKRMVGETSWDGEIIVDGPTLCVFFECDVWFCLELKSREATIAVAKAILGMSNARRQWELIGALMVSMGDQLPKEEVVR